MDTHTKIKRTQVKYKPLCDSVLNTRLLMKFIVVKMNLDNYDGLYNPRKHVQMLGATWNW